MIHHTTRIGRFTSSQMHRLMSLDRSGKKFGAPALTYIKEKEAERCLGRSIDTGAYSPEMTWGKVMEAYVFSFVLGIEYTLCSKETVVHPKYAFWSGSPDFTKTQTAGEIKCYYPKKFFEYSKALLQLKEGVITLEDFKAEFKAEYWQVVSNGVILNKPKCELIVFTPTHKQLCHIIELMDEGWFEKLGLEPWMYRFIDEARDKFYKLPHIPEHSEWPNFVSYEFQPPAEDIILLTKTVINAEKLLTDGL